MQSFFRHLDERTSGVWFEGRGPGDSMQDTKNNDEIYFCAVHFKKPFLPPVLIKLSPFGCGAGMANSSSSSFVNRRGKPLVEMGLAKRIFF